MSSTPRAFVVMPFGRKPGPDGVELDCDAIYRDLLAPAIVAAGLLPHRADADRRGGSIHLDMFQDLLLAEFVVADLTLDNPNVWYELGVRHALRSGGSVLVYAQRDRLPFDIAGQRMQRYRLKDGRPDPATVTSERLALTEAIVATLGAWRGRRTSPVYQQIPNLREPDWKTLRVGSINEYWEALERWQSRIAVARGKKRPGDILVLAEEAPSSVLAFEALRTAADALLKLNRPRFALSVLEEARQLDPDDLRARQLEGVALGRAGRYHEAREALRALAEKHRDGETLSLVARTWKDEWRQDWEAHPQRVADPPAAARDTAALLRAATEAYATAFRADAANYFPGINALTLARLWEHVTQRRSTLPLDRIAAGLAWCIEVAVERDKDYWSLASRAELALVEGRRDEAIDVYNDAVALAVTHRDLFALDSSSQQLDLLGAIGFRSDIVAQAAAVIERAETRLAAVGTVPGRPSEPKRVVVFSGHMIDDPGVRGVDRDKPPRFPATKAEAAARAIRVRLDAIGAGAGDLGFCGGASGGDLLFGEACLERGMHLELRLARVQPQFMAQSVTFADRDHRWERSFMRVIDNPATTVLVMPDELGPAPEGISVYDRCNRWILYSALSHGLNKASFVTLWNGEPGDGPGGTQHMVALVRRLTGRQPEIIDPASL